MCRSRCVSRPAAGASAEHPQQITDTDLCALPIPATKITPREGPCLALVGAHSQSSTRTIGDTSTKRMPSSGASTPSFSAADEQERMLRQL